MRRHSSISNIAWPSTADAEALDMVADLGFAGVELAPSKVFGSLDDVGDDELRHYRSQVEARGLRIPALQALLYGVTDAHLFQSRETRARLAERLDRISYISRILGSSVCVFGSPGLRDPGSLALAQAFDIAADFFGEIAAKFAARDTTIAFEANPAIYNCRFITGTPEAISLVERVSSPGFALQLDIGTAFANEENAAVLEKAAGLAVHCHISEPNLIPVGSGNFDHTIPGNALVEAGYKGWVSIEMRTDPDWRLAMKNAALIIDRYYDQ